MRIVAAAAIIGLSIIIAFIIAGSAARYRFHSNETIVVTGLAAKDYVSDLIVWQGSYSRKSLDLKGAYASLKQDELTIRQYLHQKGITEDEMVFSSVQINKEFNTKTDENGRMLGQEFTGYNLSQTVRVESSNVDKIEKIDEELL